jgi:alkylation response protein AidB-like acyl-CoA dehydrogenase
MQDSAATTARNFFLDDVNLQRLLRRRAPDLLARSAPSLAAFGAWVGTDVDAAAAYTDRLAPPVLESCDRDGQLEPRLVCNARYEAMHREVYEHGIVGLNHGPSPEPFLLTFAMGYLLAQADISIHCPATLTGAVAHVLDRFAPPDLRERYLPELVRRDGRACTGATWATERQGGSDMGAAEMAARTTGEAVTLTGLKWFCSNAAADVALVTARPEDASPGSKGLGLYLVPRLGPDGTPNRLRLRRLKDKLGTRGLPTGEIEFLGAQALEVAPPPQGFKLMMEALEFSRIHNALAAAGIQRRTFAEAAGYTAARHAFGAPLASFPMVRDTLLDMQVELEAAVALAFEAAAAFDAAASDATARPWLRTATALAKHRTAEQALPAASRAIELLGGNGYTEEYVTARLLRDAQVLTVWEGPANIQALELLRVVRSGQGGFEAFESRIAPIVAAAPAGLGDGVRAGLEECRRAVAYVRDHPDEAPYHGRRLLELMADVLSAALLVEEASADVAGGDARKAIVANRFIAHRLAPPTRRGLAPVDDPGQRHFDAMIGYQEVPPAALRRQRSTAEVSSQSARRARIARRQE